MELSYEKMLDRAYMLLPEEAKHKERFELPKPESQIQGRRTFVKNFGQIAKDLGRKPQHIYKFITKEIGTAASIEGPTLILAGKFGFRQVNEIFESYIKHYVLCTVCGKPDTKFQDTQGVKMLKCTACGAIGPVKRL